MATPNLLSTLVAFAFFFVSGVRCASFTLTNNCAYTVWPGVLSSAGSTSLASTGFALDKGESKTLSAPAGWSGRFWGRSLCGEDSTGKFTCRTGDCGSGKVECSGSGALPPATLAEFTLNGADGKDFYDVSLVDGYNLPMLVVPHGGSGNCSITGCLVDLNGACPSDLKVESADGGGEGVACKSACEAFGSEKYCCRGAYGSPNTCKPTSYSEFFKQACPRAYSYAYDDSTSTFTCTSADYVITFCPPISTSQKAATGAHPGAANSVPLINATSAMVFMGAEAVTDHASPPLVGRGRPLALSLSLLAVAWLARLF